MISGETGGIWPWSQSRASFPPAGVEKDDVARTNLDVLDLFQGFEILPMDGSSRFQPTLRSGLTRQSRRIEKNTARDDTIFQSIDASSRTTSGCLDLFYRNAVVSL